MKSIQINVNLSRIFVDHMIRIYTVAQRNQ